MKTISKKITVYIFIGLLVFCSTSTIYYRAAHAMEWVGGALAFEEALKWTLAVLGITATAGMTDAYWDEYGDEFVDYAIENGSTQQEVTEWQMKLCQGVLDKASDCWTYFKSWASSLIQNNDTPVDPSVPFATGEYVINLSNELCPGRFDVSSINITGSLTKEQFLTHKFTSCIICDAIEDSGFRYFSVLLSDTAFGVRLSSGSNCYFDKSTVNGYYAVNYGNYFQEDTRNFLQYPNYLSNVHFYGFGLTSVTGNFADLYTSFDGTVPDNPDLPSDDVFQGLDGVDIPNIDVISADVPDEEDPEITLPFPGLDTSDDSISSDTYDDIIGAINDGTISINDGIDDIIGRLRVIPYDEVTGDVIPPRPDPDDPTQNVKKDDVVNDNKNNMGFTLAGLEGVFPFCIPWDIYAFMTLLIAEPEAPEFDFPIKSVNNTTEEIHVDLAPFEPVAVVVRYIFDFLFIIGLAMLTRSLIGGGSSD